MASIFIVEDEIPIIEMYKLLFSLYGHRVIGVALNGKEAVDMYKRFSEKPDIIIMDYRMPLKNGIDASREIIAIDSRVKIIFASADDTIKEHASSIGAFSFKTKPFTNEKIIRNIDKALSNIDNSGLIH